MFSLMKDFTTQITMALFVVLMFMATLKSMALLGEVELILRPVIVWNRRTPPVMLISDGSR